MFSFSLTVTVLAVLLVLLVFFGVFIAVVALLVWQAERDAKSPH